MDQDWLTLTEFTEWMSERGFPKSREEWYRRLRAEQFEAVRHGNQWEIRLSEAQAFLERLRAQES